MPAKFCSSCGKKINFELKAPNFCPNCGKELNASLKTQVNTSAKTQYSGNKSKLELESDVDFNLTAQIKANLLRTLNTSDIFVSNIPDFRIPIEDLDKHPELGQS
jgi:predicted RNA-binding Zn-ribbon protein involved in translation (DUF1610 family)